MDVAKLVLEFVKVLAWPAVVAIAAFAFRGELANLISRLQNMKLPGGTEFNFKEAITSIEKSSKEGSRSLKSPAQRNPPQSAVNSVRDFVEQRDLMPSQSGYDLGYYLDIAERDPNLALAGIRMELERMLYNMLVLSDLPVDKRRLSAGQYLGILRSREILPGPIYQLLSDSLQVANAAVHVRDFDTKLSKRVINSLKVFVAFYVDWIQSNFMSTARQARRTNSPGSARRTLRTPDSQGDA